LEQLADVLFRSVVCEITVRVESLGRIANHDFWVIDCVHIQEHEDLTEMVLRPRRRERVSHKTKRIMTKMEQLGNDRRIGLKRAFLRN
jgi:hypothetical protein